MEVTIISMTSSPETTIEFAGRICYRSEMKQTLESAMKFITARVREGHESILEHASVTFFVEGISRSCSHQLVRHRLASYSQESQRYVDMSENVGFVVPPSIANADDPEVLALYLDALDAAGDAYDELRSMGVRKEDARFVLPNATQTSIVVTMNFRELRHFFEVRLNKAAQWEIRKLALAMLELVYEISPSTFGDLYKEYVE